MRTGRGAAWVAEGTAASAGLDIKALETSTLERMREMARRKKEEKERQKQQQELINGNGTHLNDNNSSSGVSTLGPLCSDTRARSDRARRLRRCCHIDHGTVSSTC